MTSSWADQQWDRVEQQGIQVDFSIYSPNDTDADDNSALVAGKNRLFRFDIHDSSGTPLKGLYPAAWLHPRSETDGLDNLACQNKLKTFLGGGLLSQAELDLNVYHVLTLNDDASVSVVDPLFGFGGSKLLNMLPLPAMGYDWAIANSGNTVYISIPELHQLVKLDTLQWQVSHILTGESWQNPKQLAIQPDQHYLWLAVDQGLAVFERESFSFVKQLSLITANRAKPDLTEFVFSPDSRYLYVADKTSGILSVIDTGSLKVIKQLQLGEQPSYLAYSTLAEAVYISHQGDGQIIVVDGQNHTIISQAQSEPGLGMIRFSPDGRWGFIVNPTTNRLSILDASNNQIVQTGLVEPGPESISFSSELAYIRHRGSHTILMITLASQEIGKPGRPIPVADMPAGDQPAGLFQHPTPAAGIVQAPGANAVLIANPGDQAVYFYKEGMAAPMGQFGNYGKAPRAILAIDRSLQETQQPGVYQTIAALPETAGLYDVIYFMNSPRFMHCFEIQIQPDANSLSEQASVTVSALPANTDSFKATHEIQLNFQLQGDAEQIATVTPTSTPIDALVMLTSGRWQQKFKLHMHSDNSDMLSLRFTPPLSGVYRVFLTADSIKLNHDAQQFMYQVK